MCAEGNSSFDRLITTTLANYGGRMPKVKVKGKTKHFPYTKKGKAEAKKAKKMQTRGY